MDRLKEPSVQIVTCHNLEACRSVELLQNSVRFKANRNDGQFAESAATAHPTRQGPSLLFGEGLCGATAR